MNPRNDEFQSRRAGAIRTLVAWPTAGAVRSANAALSVSIVLGCGCAIAAGEAAPEPHDPVRASLFGQAPADLQQIYRVCARESVAGRLSGAEITACSIAYDVLLKRQFGGDFAALLNWSRAKRDEPVDCADADCSASEPGEKPVAQGVN